MTILDSKQLARVLQRGEGRQVEFKEGVASDGRIARTICAFANTSGGILLVGVSDRGAIRGVPRPSAVAGRLLDFAEYFVLPPVAVRIEVLPTGAGPVVLCSVPLSPARPHATATRADEKLEFYVRRGSSNRAATPHEVAVMDGAKTALTPSPLEQHILATLEKEGALTIGGFLRLHGEGVGKQKARQSFGRLERAGFVVAHGLGAARCYELP